MRKLLSAALVLSLLFALCACGGEKGTALEDHEWKMQLAQSNDLASAQDADQRVLAVGEASDAYPDAAVAELILTASGGKLSLQDKTNGQEYTGTYSKQKSYSEGTIYEIVLDGVTGYATVSATEADGAATPTLPVNLGEVSLYFYPAN